MLLPYLSSARGDDLEGAYFLAWFVGIISVAVTAPLAIVAVDRVDWTPRISRLGYIAVLLALSGPGFAFQSIAVSASVMGAFTGSFVGSQNVNVTRVEFANTYVILYVIIGSVTYPFVQRNRLAAILAAGLVGVFLFVFMLLRISGIIRY